MERDELQKRLLASFVEELAGHVAALERDLLALEKGGAPAELLHSLFRTVHTIKGSSRAASVHLVEQATHRIEDILSPMREGKLAPGPAIFEVLFGTADALRDAGERIARGQSLDGSPLETFIHRLGATVHEPQPMSLAQPAQSAQQPSRDPGIRASHQRVDALLGTSNELLVAFRRLSEHDALLHDLRMLAGRRDADVRAIAAAIDRFSSAYEGDRRRLALWVHELDTSLKQLRMIRFGDACRGLDRAVRDVARAGGKEVDLVIHGEDVELDRDVVEGLRDPLLHLVRNAVDHGIEKPAVRRAAGKSERGTITIRAYTRGIEAVITVEDDGAGLDVGAIRDGLRKRGAEVPARDEDVVQSIFAAGFTTAPLVTDVSGRGVGLDVVKRAVEGALGAIDLSFRPGRGTYFTLRLPVTRSSMRVLFARSGRRTWAIPGIAVKRLLRVAPDEIKPVGGADTIAVDGVPVPIVPLGVALGEPVTSFRPDSKAPIVIVSAQGSDVALVVDELIEEREVVVKPLGPRLSASVWVSGATVLPNGHLSMVLNVASVVSRARGLPVGGPIFAVKAAEGETRTILLVDDSLTTRILERSILESAGYRVFVAGNGQEAWEMLQARGADIVVTDVEMPVMDGFELTETIRDSARFRDLPVVLVTALSSEEDRARGLDVGASAYLVKSAFDQKNLLDTIGQLL